MTAAETSMSGFAPATGQLISAVLAQWPEHRNYIDKSFSSRTPGILQSTEVIAGKILLLAGDNLRMFCDDYRWTCERLLEEELYFRRNGSYRFSKISDVIDQVYRDEDYMRSYLNGLLLSQALWVNHAHVFDYYLKKYLPLPPAGGNHLEIGPGHGLFLYFAHQQKTFRAVAGWDISPTAIVDTKTALNALGMQNDIELKVRDIMSLQPSGVRYDSIVLSEILEHIESPLEALISLKRNMNSDAHLFVNVPVNSPAPDHIYLLKTPEESLELVKNAGFRIIDSMFFPGGGVTLEKARKNQITISCAIIAQPA